MSAQSLVLRGRVAAEALMVDACLVERVAYTDPDPDNGTVTETAETVYSGKCRVQILGAAGGIARPNNLGEATVYQQPSILQLPMSVVGVDSGDRVTVTASALDPDLVDRKFWARDLMHKTHSTSRRLGLEEVTS